jgi:AraC-like DNA-binding protein
MTSPSAIGLKRFEMLRGQAFDRHVHDVHQLAWASSGALVADAGGRYWVLPPNLALWIPAGTWHTMAALRETVMQGVYLDPAVCPVVWAAPTVVAVSPLARHLIEYLAGDGMSDKARVSAETVLLDVLRPVGKGAIELPVPADPRAREIADFLLSDPAACRTLEELARDVRSSPRTLLRIFLAETGLTFNQWRAHARLQAAIVLLAEGQPVGRVAELVGYATPSAFAAAFRRVTGHTPAGYLGQVTALPRHESPGPGQAGTDHRGG